MQFVWIDEYKVHQFWLKSFENVLAEWNYMGCALFSNLCDEFNELISTNTTTTMQHFYYYEKSSHIED